MNFGLGTATEVTATCWILGKESGGESGIRTRYSGVYVVAHNLTSLLMPAHLLVQKPDVYKRTRALLRI